MSLRLEVQEAFGARQSSSARLDAAEHLALQCLFKPLLSLFPCYLIYISYSYMSYMHVILLIIFLICSVISSIFSLCLGNLFETAIGVAWKRCKTLIRSSRGSGRVTTWSCGSFKRPRRRRLSGGFDIVRNESVMCDTIYHFIYHI